jgi:hypothetical protein
VIGFAVKGIVALARQRNQTYQNRDEVWFGVLTKSPLKSKLKRIRLNKIKQLTLCSNLIGPIQDIRKKNM